MCSVVYSNSTSPVTLNLNLLLGFFSIQQYGQFVDCILTGSQLKLPFQWVKRPCFTKAVKYKLHLKGWELQPRLLFIQPGNQGTVLFSSADAHTCQLLFPLQPDWLPSDSPQSWQCWDFLTVAVLHCLGSFTCFLQHLLKGSWRIYLLLGTPATNLRGLWDCHTESIVWIDLLSVAQDF